MPDGPRRSRPAPSGIARGSPRVGEVDDVVVAPVVGDVLDPDELERPHDVVAPVLEHPLRPVGNPGRRRRIPEVGRPDVGAVGLLARRDHRRHLDEVPGRAVGGREVAVVVDVRVVGDERVQRPLVVPERRAACGRVHVHLGRGRVERVVSREHDRVAVALEADVVLVVVPPHPVDRAVRAALRVERDDHARLLGERLVERDGRRMPRVALPQDDVAGLLVRQQQLALEAMLLSDEEVRAEPLVVRVVADRRTRLGARRRCAG